MEVTAYHKWLFREYGHNRELLADQIMWDCTGTNSMAFELLSVTGDKNFTPETFTKAADWVIDNVPKHGTK